MMREHRPFCKLERESMRGASVDRRQFSEQLRAAIAALFIDMIDIRL
jgi:hypothetical protein